LFHDKKEKNKQNICINLLFIHFKIFIIIILTKKKFFKRKICQTKNKQYLLNHILLKFKLKTKLKYNNNNNSKKLLFFNNVQLNIFIKKKDYTIKL